MTIEYPKFLYVADCEDLGLVATTNLSEIADIQGAPVKIARYVLAGTGALNLSAPRYVEDAQT